ncbi:major facilitator superfamily domain-containing protein [Nemania sp. NC0429]|nr:major facilitator superfamily domain-containing protein [Nemania sp. NC0429]
MAALYLSFHLSLPAPSHRAARDDSRPLPLWPDFEKHSNPREWSSARKYAICGMLSIAAMLTTYAAGAYSPAADLMAAEYGASRTVVLTGMTTFCVGFAVAPMLLAPFSEINGRYNVFVAAGCMFVLSQFLCGALPDLSGILVARFLSGFGSSVFSTNIGGVITDMWSKKDRNTPMALYSGAVLAGTGLGPLATSFIVFRYGSPGQPLTGITAPWRWVFWHQVILDGLCMLAIAFFLPETRGSVLLSRKAKALNNWYEALEERGIYGVWIRPSDHNVPLERISSKSTDGEEAVVEETQVQNEAEVLRIRWTVEDEQNRASIGRMILVSVSRPFYMLFTEPVVFAFSLWASFSWAILFLCFNAIPLVFERQYGFKLQEAAYLFVSMVIGSAVGTAVGVTQENLLKYPKWVARDEELPHHGWYDKFWAIVRRKFPAEAPESRVYMACFMAGFLPLGLYLFGFTAKGAFHWVVPAIGIAFATFGVYTIYLATFNYLADSYHIYASSALAAQSFCRYTIAGVFPLIATPLFTNLGESTSGGLLGAIATVLTVVPFLLSLYGSRIRKSSKLASALSS